MMEGECFIYHVMAVYFPCASRCVMNIVIYTIIVQSYLYIDLSSKFGIGQSPCKFAVIVGDGIWPVLLVSQSKH